MYLGTPRAHAMKMAIMTMALTMGNALAADASQNTASKEDSHHKLHQTMESMHKDMMAMKPKGDTDQDFVAMMIRHHQGAIDMAQVELDQGKDAKAKDFARKTIEKQKKEIAELESWLKSAEGGQKKATR